jgi:preprotein translocase subunit SecA
MKGTESLEFINRDTTNRAMNCINIQKDVNTERNSASTYNISDTVEINSSNKKLDPLTSYSSSIVKSSSEHSKISKEELIEELDQFTDNIDNIPEQKLRCYADILNSSEFMSNIKNKIIDVFFLFHLRNKQTFEADILNKLESYLSSKLVPDDKSTNDKLLLPILKCLSILNEYKHTELLSEDLINKLGEKLQHNNFSIKMKMWLTHILVDLGNNDRKLPILALKNVFYYLQDLDHSFRKEVSKAHDKENVSLEAKYNTHKIEVSHLWEKSIDMLASYLSTNKQECSDIIGNIFEANHHPRVVSKILEIKSEQFSAQNLLVKIGSLSDYDHVLQTQIDFIELQKEQEVLKQRYRENEEIKRRHVVDDLYSFQNAFSSADTKCRYYDSRYWYSESDIASINSIWMEAVADDFLLPAALGQQSDISLESILQDTLNEYSQHGKATILPLNIAGAHWVTLAIIPYENRNIVLYKDSMGCDSYAKQREEVKSIITAKLQNVDFKNNKHKEQNDSWNCGVFVINNMREIALLSKNEELIFGFEEYRFQNDIKKISELRVKTFPDCYAQSLCLQDKRNQILSYHHKDLEAIKSLIKSKSKFSSIPISIEDEQINCNGIRVSIRSLKGEAFRNIDYKYLYVFSKGNNCQHSLQEIITAAIPHFTGFYTVEDLKITILDSELNFNGKIDSKIDPNSISLEDIYQNKLKEYRELEDKQRDCKREIESVAKAIKQKGNLQQRQRIDNIDQLIVSLSQKDLSDLNLEGQNPVLGKIIDTAYATSHTEVIDATLLIINKLRLSNVNKDFLDKMVSNTSHPMEALKCLQIQDTLTINDSIASFLFRQLNNEDLEVREISYTLLNLYKSVLPDTIKEVLDLENKIRTESDIIVDCNLLIANGKTLTYNCFFYLTPKLGNEEVQALLVEVIKLDKQPIPKIIIDQYNSLFKNQIAKLTTSLSRASYINLEDIGDIEPLIEIQETRDDALTLIRHHVSKGHDLSETIISKIIKYAEISHPIALNILRLIKRQKDDLEQLKDHSLTIKDRLQALDRIVSDKKYHNRNTAVILESLIQYEPRFRSKVIKSLIEILPEEYTAKGYSNSFLNNIVNYDVDLDLVTANKLIDKDHGANLVGITKLVIDKIAVGQFKEDGADLLAKLYFLGKEQLFNKQSLILQLKLDYETIIEKEKSHELISADNREDKKKIEQKIKNLQDEISILTQSIKDQIPSLAEIALYNNDKSIRLSIINILEDFTKLESIKEIVAFDQLQNLKSYITLEIESSENLDKLREVVIKGYMATNQQVNMLINLLDGKGQVTIASEILLETAVKYGLSNEEFSNISDKILHAPDILKELHIINLIGINANKLNEEIIKLLESIEFGEDIEIKVIAILSSLDREITNPNILTRISKYLVAGKSDLQIHLARGLLNQIERKILISSISDEVIENVRSIALKPRDGGDENDLLSQIAFKSLYKVAQGNFISEYYANLRLRIGDEHKEILKELDDYIAGKASNKDKHRLINAINLSLVSIGKVDTSIFEAFSQAEWEKEILATTLVFRAIQHSKEQVDEFELYTFRDRINALEDIEVDGGFGVFELKKQEDILEQLIDKQSADHLNLNDINDLMGYIGNNPKTLTILKGKSYWQELPKLWLSSKLQNLQLETELNVDSPEIKELTNLVTPYKNEIIELAVTKLNNKNNNIQDIVELFRSIRMSGLTINSQEYFLANELKNRASDCKIDLYGTVINALLSSKYKNDNATSKLEGIRNSELIEVSDQSLLKNVEQNLAKMHTNGWSFYSLVELLNKIQNEQDLEELNKSLYTIYEYRLREYDTNVREEKLIDIISQNDSQKWSSAIHDLAIFHSFSASKEKTPIELIEELKERNPNIRYVDNILEEYNKIIEIYNFKKGESNKSIGSWDTDEIEKWSNEVKKKNYAPDLYEKLAVITRAIEINSEEKGKKISPRPIQLMSVLIMLNAKDKGRLAQINTGEGKTTIVAMLAVMKALEGNGHKVDIITSSPELARPQSEEQRSFFKKFGLSVAHNCKDDDADIKERYKADIVYGTAEDFQGDILRDEFSKLGTRSGRICDIAIVDEVDSMLLDGKNNIVMLSSPTPAMDYLEPILALIWNQVEAASQSIIDIDGKAYYVEKSNTIGEDKKMLSAQEILYPLEGSKENFLKTSTENYIRKVLRDENLKEQVPEEYPKLEAPKHLRDFILKVQLPNWIDSAIYAKYRCELKKHYVLKDRKIAPVDASNTGVVQTSMHWSNGLHQFLQIKHGTKISAEGLTTNFISNVTYFQRYGGNIYGLTGTLGSKKEKELLSKVYNVDTVSIPTFKQKQYRELESIITAYENDWYSNIVKSSINKLNNGRGVLVIAQYITEVDEIKKRLIEAGYDERKIKVYRDEGDSKVVKEKLQSGEIIIATNIAGRGTDIELSDKVEENGGLHVCVTFLPTNERVEQQNVGRTSRTGNKGTAQLILLNKDYVNIDDLRSFRNSQEELKLERDKLQIEKVITKDALFEKFCDLLNEILPHNKTQYYSNDESGRIQELQRKIDLTKRKIIEEKFGLWLKLNEKNFEKLNKQEALEFFEKFKQDVLALWDDLQNDRKAQINPIFYVLIANLLIDQEKYEEAIAEFTKAIELDPYFAANAYYGRGYARIAKYCGKFSDQSNYEEQAQLAIKDFQEAKKIIEENFEPMQHIIQNAVAKYGDTDITPVSEQVQHKLTLYGVQKNTIDNAIGIGYSVLDQEIADLEKQLGETDNIDKQDSIKKQIRLLKDSKADRALGLIGRAKEKNYCIEIKSLEMKDVLPGEEDVKLYEEEIIEYKNNGFRGGFAISEIPPVDWLSVIGLSLIGVSQIIGGAAIAVFSLGSGSSIGMGMITEGVSDLISAVTEGILNRSFGWESWAVQKSISFTVSLACAGIGAIKDAGKTAIAGFKQLASTGIKATTETIKQGWKIAAKAIGVTLAKGVAKEMVNQLIDYGVNQALMPEIEKVIREKVEPQIQSALLNNPNVEKLLTLDGQNRNNHYHNLIIQKSRELMLSNEKNFWINVVDQVVTGIASGKCSNSDNKYVQALAYAKQIFEAGKALDNLINFTENFNEQLKKEIDKIAEKIDLNQTNSKLDQHLQQEKQNLITTRETTQIVHTAPILKDMNDHKNIESQIGKNKFKEEYQATVVASKNTPKELADSLSILVLMKMSNTIQRKLIKPLTSTAVNLGINQFSREIDKAINSEIGDYQAERRTEFQQDERVHRIPKKLQKRAEDSEAQAKANAIIKDLKNGGEAGIMHMGAISDEAGVPIKIYDESGKLLKIIGAEKGGAALEVRHVKPNKDNPNGHFTLNKKDSKGNYVEAPRSGGNNCLFDVIAAQLPENHTLQGGGVQLRNNTADRMSSESGKNKLAAIAHDIMRLEQYKKDALYTGGARYVGKNDADAAVVLDNSQNRRAASSNAAGLYSNPAHPRGHSSHNIVGGQYDRVEEYSASSTPSIKTGFLCRSDQDIAAHIALSSQDAQNAMAFMNGLSSHGPYNDQYNCTVKLPGSLFGGLQAANWNNRVRQGLPQPINEVVIVLRHQAGQKNNLNADVFVQTFFPKI